MILTRNFEDMDMDSTKCPAALSEFLAPLRVDVALLTKLSNEFSNTFTTLAAQSVASDQFHPTPILESMLRTSVVHGK